MISTIRVGFFLFLASVVASPVSAQEAEKSYWESTYFAYINDVIPDLLDRDLSQGALAPLTHGEWDFVDSRWRYKIQKWTEDGLFPTLFRNAFKGKRVNVRSIYFKVRDKQLRPHDLFVVVIDSSSESFGEKLKLGPEDTSGEFIDPTTGEKRYAWIQWNRGTQTYCRPEKVRNSIESMH